jgi:hypothetical protein
MLMFYRNSQPKIALSVNAITDSVKFTSLLTWCTPRLKPYDLKGVHNTKAEIASYRSSLLELADVVVGQTLTVK